MTNPELIQYLKERLGTLITPAICADICMLADRLPTLVHAEAINSIQPGRYEKFTFAIEKMEAIEEEIRPLHQAHWSETESHRHGLALNPDYGTFIQYEKAGRYVLFTVRDEQALLGNCAMYLSESTHTKTLIATEDTLYFLPEARSGKTAAKFIEYCENALKQMGVREINVSVKTINKAGRFFGMLGYKHVENGLTKVLED